MSYATVQAGVSAVIQKLSGYDTSNVKENDFRALDAGKNAVVLRRGTSRHEDLTLGSGSGNTRTVRNRWRVKVELWIPQRTDHSTQRSDMVTVFDAIYTQLLKWPFLDGVSGVTDSKVTDAGEPEEFTFGKGRSKRWWRQVINVDVDEIAEITLSE